MIWQTPYAKQDSVDMAMVTRKMMFEHVRVGDQVVRCRLQL